MQQNPAVELPIADVPIGVEPGWRQTIGRALIVVASWSSLLSWPFSFSRRFGLTTVGFDNWRPVAIAFLGWAVCLCVGLVLTRGQRGEQAVFLLPAVLITVAFVIFPDDLRAVHCLSQLESQCRTGQAVHRSGQLPPVVRRPRILGSHAEHGVLRCSGPGPIRHRLWTGAPA